MSVCAVIVLACRQRLFQRDTTSGEEMTTAKSLLILNGISRDKEEALR